MTQDVTGMWCDEEHIVAFPERVSRNESELRLGIIFRSSEENATAITEDGRVVLLYPSQFCYIDEDNLDFERYNNLLDKWRMVKWGSLTLNKEEK